MRKDERREGKAMRATRKFATFTAASRRNQSATNQHRLPGTICGVEERASGTTATRPRSSRAIQLKAAAANESGRREVSHCLLAGSALHILGLARPSPVPMWRPLHCVTPRFLCGLSTTELGAVTGIALISNTLQPTVTHHSPSAPSSSQRPV